MLSSELIVVGLAVGCGVGLTMGCGVGSASLMQPLRARVRASRPAAICTFLNLRITTSLRATSPGIGAHQFGVGQDVLIHGGLELGGGGLLRGQVYIGIKRVKPEEVAMGAAAGRARAAITGPVEAAAALATPVRPTG